MNSEQYMINSNFWLGLQHKDTVVKRLQYKERYLPTAHGLSLIQQHAQHRGAACAGGTVGTQGAAMPCKQLSRPNCQINKCGTANYDIKVLVSPQLE